MAEISPVTRGRARPTGNRRETRIWYAMRVSGLLLFVLALAHFSILHFIFDPADQNAAFIAGQRWNQLFWRAFDWTMLMLVLFHSFLGLRTVVNDHVSHVRARRALVGGLAVLGVVLLVLGSWVVFTLPAAGVA